MIELEVKAGLWIALLVGLDEVLMQDYYLLDQRVRLVVGIDNLVWAYCVGIRCIDWRSYSSILVCVLVTHLSNSPSFISWHLYGLVRNLSLVPMIGPGFSFRRPDYGIDDRS